MAKSVITDFNKDTMSQLIAKTERFLFSARELSPKLLEHIQAGRTGYWQHQFDRLESSEQTVHWNLAISNGQILYSGNRIWSAHSLFRVVWRYVVQTRTEQIKPEFNLLKQRAIDEKLTAAQVLRMMKQSNIINNVQLLAALETKILNDLDIYLLMGSGAAKFVQADNIATDLPMAGFSADRLLDQAKKRQSLWFRLKPQIPSMNLCPILDLNALKAANLNEIQQQRIEMLVKSDRTLHEIADGMAKDSLEVAVMFAKLVKMELVALKPPKKTAPSTIMVIDDSPLLLAQFQNWVLALGYPVVICQDATTALNTIARVMPSAIFIDINMPIISGFELVKQIRQQPELAEIPLAILTGEQRLSNKWRAQWIGCEFLTKPLTSAGISDFQVQLEDLLPRLLNGTPAPIDDYSNN
jgi:CheY-like chemotaxis protein